MFKHVLKFLKVLKVCWGLLEVFIGFCFVFNGLAGFRWCLEFFLVGSVLCFLVFL